MSAEGEQQPPAYYYGAAFVLNNLVKATRAGDADEQDKAFRAALGYIVGLVNGLTDAIPRALLKQQSDQEAARAAAFAADVQTVVERLGGPPLDKNVQELEALVRAVWERIQAEKQDPE